VSGNFLSKLSFEGRNLMIPDWLNLPFEWNASKFLIVDLNLEPYYLFIKIETFKSWHSGSVLSLLPC